MSRFDTNVEPGDSFRPLPRALFLATIVAIAAVSWVVPKWIAVSSLLRMVGGALRICGMMVNILTSRQFRLAATPIRPFEHLRGARFENRQLVFFAIILPLALVTFWLLQSFLPGAGS